jgi:hypothetical protein
MEVLLKTRPLKDRTKYDIISIAKGNDALSRKNYTVGTAFQYEDQPYYVVKLWTFPSSTFYMVKKENAEGEYLIYSRVNQTDQGPRFTNPVGRGVLDHQNKTQLKLTFFLLGLTVSMSLYPAQ